MSRTAASFASLAAALLFSACATTPNTGTTATPAEPAPGGAAADAGAYVVTLGADTIAAEQFSRTGNVLTGTLVTRTPATATRDYTVTLDAAGMVTSAEATARRLVGAQPAQKVTLQVGQAGDSVTLGVQTGDSAVRTTRGAAAAGAVPFVNLSTGLLELVTRRAAAMGGDSVAVPIVPLGVRLASATAVVKRNGADSVLIAIAGGLPYRARVDAQGRILGLQGLETTQRVVIARLASYDVRAAARRFAQRDSAGQALGMLSPLDSASTTVGQAAITVKYSRPSRRGRTVIGNLIPYDQWWRTGANAATMFTTSRDLVFSGTTVPAGSYTLFSQLGRDGTWKLIFNKQTGQWGTDYHPEKDLARVDITRSRLAQPVERFTIALDATSNGGTMRLMWDDVQGSVGFTAR